VQRAFIIRPFGKKKDRADREIDFDRVHDDLIKPALEAVGLAGDTTGEIVEAGNIREDVFGLILEADLVVCDITIHNPNVFYELGIRHAVRKSRSVLIRGKPVADEVPFDNLTERFLAYDVNDPGAALERLTDTLIATLASPKGDSPFFKVFPTLQEVDPASVQVLPKDFREEVARARAAKDAARLRLLSQDVENLRFQWPALRVIGKAQWEAEDYEGSRQTYQKLILNDADDLDANFSLANLYERQYQREKRLDKRSELLQASDDAIKTILANNRASHEQRIQALNLIGRNATMKWRQAFEGLTNDDQWRKAAVNRKLIEACNSYLEAYLNNLNHYQSGLAALEMCAIAKSLADQEIWEDAFDDEKEAKDKKEELLQAFDQLKHPVELAVKAAQKLLPKGTDDRIWAEIANAKRLFLTDAKETRVVRAYEDAVPKTQARFVGAAKAELELLATLGIRDKLAENIIKELGIPIDAPPPAVVILAGHRVDEPGRSQIRFPESAILDVRNKLREKLDKLSKSAGGIRVLSSAAPGTDIICHELCRELGVKSTVCLPTPVDNYSKTLPSG
jgi:hypothetical protein